MDGEKDKGGSSASPIRVLERGTDCRDQFANWSRNDVVIWVLRMEDGPFVFGDADPSTPVGRSG